MGNVISSFFSGFAQVAGKLFGSPLDFLAGKSCSSVCGSTWDFICYIENFCIANLLKLALVALLFYFVLLFFYLLYKLGICQCVGRTLCKMVWACFATWFSVWEYGCYFLCYKLHMLKRKRHKHRRDIEGLDTSKRHKHKRDIEELDTSTSEKEEEEATISYHVPRHVEDRRALTRQWRDYRGDHLRRSLRPRSHRIRVGISRDSVYVNKRKPINRGSTIHDIRVTRTSKFAQKGAMHRRRRR